MNSSATVYEWLMMPLYLFTHSDRLFFLINVSAYFLMPGLVFTALRLAGAAGPVAWTWMWILPVGLCYAIQAGSICNDLIGATFALAAVSSFYRAQEKGRIDYLWLGLLAACLLTGIKGPDLPLALPLLCASWPALRLMRLRPILSALVLMAGLVISFLPTAILNYGHTGDWTGDPANSSGAGIKEPAVGLVGNGLLLIAQNFFPPFLPWARPLSGWIWQRAPEHFRQWLMAGFPRFGLRLAEAPVEESAGMGLLVGLLVCAAAIAAAGALKSREPGEEPGQDKKKRGMWVGIAAWVALLGFAAKMGSDAPGRLLAPYYPLLVIPIFINGPQHRLVRQKWFQCVGALAGLAAVMAIVVTPARPLWPAQSCLRRLAALYPDNVLIKRAKKVYEVYATRNDAFEAVRAQIPLSVRTIGLIAEVSDMEASLWRPYGRREVVRLKAESSIPAPPPQWVVAKSALIKVATGESIDQWARQTGGQVVSKELVTTRASEGPEELTIILYSVPGHHLPLIPTEKASGQK